jgi:hypothetical protein
MLDFIKSLFKATSDGVVITKAPEIKTGVLVDDRSESEKDLNEVYSGEIYTQANSVVWREKTLATTRTYPVFNQGYTSSCVGWSMAKILGILEMLSTGEFVKFSGSYIYNNRTNTSQEGMNASDAYKAPAKGVTLDIFNPGEGLSEEQTRAMQFPEYAKKVGSLFGLASSKPIVLPVADIEAVASVIQTTGKPVMVWYYFTPLEWSREEPRELDILTGYADPKAYRHSVVAVDYFMENGIKYLAIEDSAHFGGITRRRISEEFHSSRNWYATYPMKKKTVRVLSVEELSKLNVKKITQPLSFIAWDSKKGQPADMELHLKQLDEVKVMQTILQNLYDKNGVTFFPQNVSTTGYYGALTRESVLKWQLEMEVGNEEDIKLGAGKIFNSQSVTEINKYIK